MSTVNLNEVAKVKHILALAQGINAKLNGDGSALDTTVPDPRPVPTLSLPYNTDSISNIQIPIWGVGLDITYTGDGQLYTYVVPLDTSQEYIKVQPPSIYYHDGTKIVWNVSTEPNLRPCVIHLCATETANYQAAEFIFTVTA